MGEHLPALMYFAEMIGEIARGGRDRSRPYTAPHEYPFILQCA